MARTRTTIRRVDPWSILKFAFVVNLVLLGIELLVAAVVWSFVQRLELIETVCDLAGSIGFQECAVDGQALFDLVLVLGLLGVVIQTGILVFMTFLVNLIFDLTGGIVVTLDDGQSPGGRGRGTGRASGLGARAASKPVAPPAKRPPPLGTDASPGSSSDDSPSSDTGSSSWPGDRVQSSTGGEDEPLFKG